jgi:hypothetical protein
MFVEQSPYAWHMLDVEDGLDAGPIGADAHDVCRGSFA